MLCHTALLVKQVLTIMFIMKKRDLLSSLLVVIAFGSCFALSIGHETSFWLGVRYFCLCTLPYIGVAAVVMFWFRSNRWLRFILASALFACIMAGNVKIAKELDMISIMTAELERICEMEDLEALGRKSYLAAEYGEYGSALEYRKKEQLFTRKATIKRQNIMAVMDFNELYSPEVLLSSEQLLALRKKYESSYAELISLERQTANCYSNLLRIFRENKWKHACLQNELLELHQKETDLRLEWCSNLYYNLKGQLSCVDDLIVFLWQRQGLFHLDKDKKIHFDSSIDEQRYDQFCQNIEAWINYETQIHEKFNSGMGLL